MSDLAAIEAIKQLKYRYFRFLDSKKWDEMAACFTSDARSWYDSGKYSFEGVDAIMAFLRDSLSDPDVISLHQGHHPEISIIDADRATGYWYLEDRIFFTKQKMMLWGAAFYEDEYRLVGGDWKIASTGYHRTFEEIQSRELSLSSAGKHLRNGD